MYLWTGEPVAYLVGEHLYGFNGRHLGWLQDEIVWDYEGVAVGFTPASPHAAHTAEPPKPARQPKPPMLPREPSPPQPQLTLGVYSELLGTMLRWGLIP